MNLIKKLNNHFFGVYCEKMVMLFFLIKGYQIISWRYKTPYGEIDLVLRKKNYLIFVEVKSTINKYFNIELSLRESQVNRIYQAIDFYVSHNLSQQNMLRRIDLIEIDGIASLKHYENFLG
jgi:putative endonuclease